MTEEPNPHKWLELWLSEHFDEMVQLRRQIHANPEVSRQEFGTTALIVERLTALGLRPEVLPVGTGVMCEIGEGETAVALRADIDALPVADLKDVPYRSTVDGACHACGHDVHTTILLGTAAALAAAPDLPGRVRLIFQPAEENFLNPGAPDVVAAGGLKDVSSIFAVHCDPRLETGKVGLRVGPITAAADQVNVELYSAGGHTARPHLTGDLVYALGRIITEVPGLLSRAVDPRAGLSLVWGEVRAGNAVNVIPQFGKLGGTIRTLDKDAWEAAPELVERLIFETLASSGVTAKVQYSHCMPPVVNDAKAIDIVRAALIGGMGSTAISDTPQSLGGEDFAWYLENAQGALLRLGVRRDGDPVRDLHQGAFDVDERAIAVGIQLFVDTVYQAYA
jgi:amidohydrolase